MSPLGPLIVALALQPAGGAPAPRRVRLFDRMPEAILEGVEAPAAGGAAAEVSRIEIGFERDLPRKLALGRRVGREWSWERDSSRLVAITADGGTRGGALRIGPGLAEDRSFVAIVVPARPLTRYVLSGRVKLERHPAAGEASAREIVQVVEHSGRIEDPSEAESGWETVLGFHRGSRLRDASGWERFELDVPFTFGLTGTLELRLLHRSGGRLEAETWFDDVVLEERRMTEAQTWRLFRERHRPADGPAGATPWRLRVTLPTAGGVKEETRDALLLPPPGRLSFPLALPEAGDQPVLRFAVGMLPEAFGIPGDGARVTVEFAPDGGTPVELGSVDLDPKNDASQRSWLPARIELAPVAGRRGTLTFRTLDVGEPDPFDAVVIATPRIEPGAPPEDPAEQSTTLGFNLLVIASDTLRADRLSAFGYGRPTSPHLERLARAGVRFSRTRAQAPWTLPSFSSILTSMHPSSHGAGRGGHDEWTPLDPGVTTLADVLARVGYETAGITANHLISPEYGLDQGFESYAIPGAVQWQRQGMESVELDAPLVVRFLEEHRHTPFFLFWHMMDPHLPYTTPPEVRAAFTDPDYRGRFEGASPIVPFQVLDPRPGRRWFTHEGPPRPLPLTDADRKFVSDYYDGEIREIDDAIGTVLDALQRTGLWERTVVAVISDHGEGLGEHGHYHHGYTLFDDQVHIPFLVRVPGREEDVEVGAPAASIDLAPTVLAALGIPAPESFQGVNRLPAAARAAAGEREPDAEDPIFLEYPSYDSSAQKGVILGDFKYLHDPWFHTEALYDTRRDPLETQDVLAAHSEVAARCRALLDEFRWEQLQRGRFHVLVRGRAGAKLRVAVSTDDLFDANFAARPPVDERHFTLDLDRRHLVLETTMETDRLELVCWCRGDALRFEVTLDGAPIGQGIRVGAEEGGRASPLSISRAGVPAVDGATLSPPRPAQALVWMEPGAGNVAPVVPTPAEAELLRALGYAH